MLDLQLKKADSYYLYQPTSYAYLSTPKPQISTYSFQYVNPYNQLRDYQEMNCILQPKGNKGGLFLGNIYSATNKQLLKENKIGAIVTVMQGVRFTSNRNIDHLILPIDDYEWVNLIEYFNKGTKFIKDNLQKTNVLVHCFAGISRSASLVIAYLLRFRGMNLNEAYSFTKAKRHQIQPNAGFLQQLKQYEYAIYQAFLNKEIKSNSLKKQMSLKQIFQSFFY